MRTLRTWLIVAALVVAGTVFYTKSIAPNEPLDSYTVLTPPTPATVFRADSPTEIFGRDFSISYYGGFSTAETLIDATYAAMYDLEQHWDPTRTDSVPGQIAASGGLAPAALPAEDYAVIRTVFDLAAETEGRFDPTIGILRQLWSAGEPSADALSSALFHTGWEKVTLDDAAMTASIVHPGLLINIGDILTGMALETVYHDWQASDIDGALLTAQGYALCYGMTGDGDPFTLGILDPNTDDGSWYAVLEMEDGLLCTTDIDDILIDPKTGKRLTSDLLSVTVFGEEGLYCDLQADLLYADGSAAVKAALAEGEKLLAITKEGELLLSDSVKDRLTLCSEKYFFAP